MKKLLAGSASAALLVGLLCLAGTPVATQAETSNPLPGLDGVTVRLCTETADADNLYCSSPGEVLNTQTAISRVYNSGNGGSSPVLPGTYRFTSAQLQASSPRAVVFGPISGLYAGLGSAWIWGYLFKNGTIGQDVDGIPTELFSYALGAPGTGIATSYTGTVGQEFGYLPLAEFISRPYYVTLYLDQVIPGGLPNPGIGQVNTLDGQVWGWQVIPQ
ncbi:MAG: hypothetical protein IPJ58_07685 [Ardenticatenia bacterium]|nr:hypothetical protein [Ardenticatenia bacterium]